MPTASPPRRPRDSQRARVYRAETEVPSSPLPGLDACARFAERVVGSLWWHARFPERELGSTPRMRPGNGARQAFFREEPDGPTITLPRRYRTKGVVLHELVHWGLGIECGLPHHGSTFARVLLDATSEFVGAASADRLAATFATHRVAIGQSPLEGPDGRLRYGQDECLRVGVGQQFEIAYSSADECDERFTARFVGYERRRSVLRFETPDGAPVRVPIRAVWDVARV
jgi:hypothetical protein